jgi:predicted RNA-binding protein
LPFRAGGGTIGPGRQVRAGTAGRKKGGFMCLSKVYADTREEQKLLLEEASRLGFDGETVRIESLFGENREMKGYLISEVDLTENYVILRKKEGE